MSITGLTDWVIFIQVIDFQVWFMLALSANFGFFGVDFDEKMTKIILILKLDLGLSQLKVS